MPRPCWTHLFVTFQARVSQLLHARSLASAGGARPPWLLILSRLYPSPAFHKPGRCSGCPDPCLARRPRLRLGSPKGIRCLCLPPRHMLRLAGGGEGAKCLDGCPRGVFRGPRVRFRGFPGRLPLQYTVALLPTALAVGSGGGARCRAQASSYTVPRVRGHGAWLLLATIPPGYRRGPLAPLVRDRSCTPPAAPRRRDLARLRAGTDGRAKLRSTTWPDETSPPCPPASSAGALGAWTRAALGRAHRTSILRRSGGAVAPRLTPVPTSDIVGG